MLHTCIMICCFLFEFDCIISRFKATEWSDFRFGKLCCIRHLHRTKTADGLNENANSLSDSRWRLWNSSCFFGYRCIQSSAALLNYFIRRWEKKKMASKLFWRQSVPFRYIHINPTPNIYIFRPIFRTVSLQCLVQYLLCWRICVLFFGVSLHWPLLTSCLQTS